jgi:hypothetical protein
MPEPSLHLYGTHGLEFRLKGTARRAINLKGPLTLIGNKMLQAEKELFEKGGARGGPPWAPLEASTIARKLRDGMPFPASPLLGTGGLMRSLSEKSNPKNIFNVTRSSVYIGSRDERVKIHRHGYDPHTTEDLGVDHVPARVPIRLGERDESDYARIINDWVIHGVLHG